MEALRMQREMGVQEPVFPLSRDLELAPRGTVPATLDRLIGPHGEAFVQEALASMRELMRLAEEEPNLRHKALLLSRVGNIALRLIRLAV